MSVCKSYGKPKVRHATKTSAYEHLNGPGNTGIHKREVYRCPRCRYWHIGRIPTPKRLRHIAELKTEERLVGQLIGTLKRVINKDLL